MPGKQKPSSPRVDVNLGNSKIEAIALARARGVSISSLLRSILEKEVLQVRKRTFGQKATARFREELKKVEKAAERLREEFEKMESDQ